MGQTRSGLSIRKSQAFFADFQYVGMVRHSCTDRMFGVGAEWGRRPAPILILDGRLAVCTENFIQVDDLMERPKLAG
jgi:hypothetical protein